MPHRSFWPLALVLLAALGLSPAAARSADDPYTTVQLALGTAEGRMVFVPAVLELQRYHHYRLSIRNPSPVEHEFDAPELALSAETERVEVYDAQGRRVATLLGQPEEIRIDAGGRVDWYLMPTKRLEGTALVCDLPGHRQAGMRAVINVR